MKAIPNRDGNANTSAYSKAVQDLAKKQLPASLISGARGDGFPSLGEIYNALPSGGGVGTPVNTGAGVSMGGQGSAKDLILEPTRLAVRRAVGDVTAIPGVGKPSPSYTADQIRRQGVIAGGLGAAMDYATLASSLLPAAKMGKANAPRLGAALDEYLAMTPTGRDAGVLYYGGRERPKVNLGPVQPRQTAAELARASGVTGAEKILSDDYARLLAEKMAELASNTAANIAGRTPPRPRPRIILDPGKIAATEAQALDNIPDWLKPIPSTDEVTKMLKQAEEYAQPNVMDPKRAAEVAKPARWENQQLWPDKWDNVNVSKEMDLTRRFANVDEALMAGPEVASKWSAQQAFREDLLRRAQAADTTLFDSGAFPSYVNERTMGTYLQIVELPKLLTNPVIAEEYVRFMQLFKP